MKKLVYAAAGLLLSAAPAMATELVTNGDFSAGVSGFTTDYANLAVQPENDATGDIIITTDPGVLCGSCFPHIGDHTTGTGNMLFVDGASNANSIVWSEALGVVPNATYTLSFWVTSLGTAGPPPEIVASVNGVPMVDTGFLPSTSGNTATTWMNFTDVLNAGSASSLTVSFVDTSDTHSFNDFALDDVSFQGPAPAAGTAIPEPPSWSLLLTALILAGGMRYRPRRSGAVASLS